MSYSTGFQQNALSLNGISILSDGYITIENGSIHNLNNLDITTLSVNTIVPKENVLQLGSIGKETIIYGSNITMLGNVTAIESVNVEFSDHNLLLNYNGTDLLLKDSGLSVCGDNNDIKASLLLDDNGDWNVTSVHNKLSVDNLTVGNLTVENPIVYDNFLASNITATNRLVSEKAVLMNSAIQSSSVSHLNAKDIKATDVRVKSLTSGNLLTNSVSFFPEQSPFIIQTGVETIASIAAGALGTVNVAFDKPFTLRPIVFVSVNGGSGSSSCYAIVSGSSITTTGCQLQARYTGTSTASNIALVYMAIGI